MSELGEIFNDLKKHNQKKRSNNRISSTEILKDKGIEFKSHNGGIHLIVSGRDGLIDFWPSTGKFIMRDSKKEGRGVRNLLKECS